MWKYEDKLITTSALGKNTDKQISTVALGREFFYWFEILRIHQWDDSIVVQGTNLVNGRFKLY